MNNEPVGFKRAVNAAWEKLPEVLIASVMALSVFGFGLWLDSRDSKRSIDAILVEQAPPRFCERIVACPEGTSGARREIAEIKYQIAGLREIITDRGHRINSIEQTLRDFRNGNGNGK